jgi:hypothetical protein
MSTEMGMNRTGAQASPIDSKKAVEAAQAVPPSSPGSEAEAAEVRKGYAAGAPPIGTVPPPASVKGVVTAAVELLQGKSPAALIDKLGERLAFERTGSRLYEALIAKHDAKGSFAGGPSREDLVAIHDEEVQHVDLLRRAVERTGADPTAMTPAADVVGVASMGLLQVVSDPRTSFAQSLEAILIAELADNDGWRRLIEMARAFGEDEMASDFSLAEVEEERHLELNRRWLDAAGLLEARGELEERPGQQAKAA